MIFLDEISEGARVKIIGIKPERFKHQDQEVREIFKELFVGRIGKVVNIDKQNHIVWIELDFGIRVWLNPQDLEKVEDVG